MAPAQHSTKLGINVIWLDAFLLWSLDSLTTGFNPEWCREVAWPSSRRSGGRMGGGGWGQWADKHHVGSRIRWWQTKGGARHFLIAGSGDRLDLIDAQCLGQNVGCSCLNYIPDKPVFNFKLKLLWDQYAHEVMSYFIGLTKWCHYDVKMDSHVSTVMIFLLFIGTTNMSFEVMKCYL